MRALEFFLQHSQCTSVQELARRLTENPNSIVVPSYQCAHPRPSLFSHIRECVFIEFVHPCSCEEQQNKLLLCVCQPTVYDPPRLNASTSTQNQHLALIEQAWLYEPIYLHLEDLEICPLNEQQQCQFRQQQEMMMDVEQWFH